MRIINTIFSKSTSIRSTTLTLVLAVYFTFVLNLTLARKFVDIFSGNDGLGILFYLSVPVFFISAFTVLFNFFIVKYVTKPFFIILIMMSAVVNYGAYTFGIIFNRDMLTNIFETTVSEATSYANPSLFFWLFLTGVLPCIYLAYVKIVYRPFKYEVLAKIVVLLVAGSLIGGIAAVYYKDYASVARNNPKIAKDIVPTYYISSTYKYARDRFFIKPLPFTAVGEDAVRKQEKEKYLVVFLVGETARGQNYEVSGYARPTNAYTNGIKNVFAFKDVASCGTATAISLPCMLSFLGQDEYSRAKFDAQDNVVDVLKRSGVKVSWIDNNTGCKGICKNVESYAADEYVPVECHDEDCTDEVFVKILDKKIAELQGQDSIIFLHLIGSHGPTYYKRYPRDHAKFQPDCQTSDLQKCTKEEIVNAYDNTILYTDYVMSKLIERLKRAEPEYHTSLIYVSDHGESLGENGIYLHGIPYSIAPIEQRRVPFMVWVSDTMMRHKKVDMACMQDALQKTGYSHDNITPTILNLMDIDTTSYVKDKDILGPCMHDEYGEEER